MPIKTNKAPAMNAADVAVIVNHLDELIEAAFDASQTFAKMKRTNKSAYVVNQWRYWQSVESGLKWAKRLACQKAGHLDGRQPESV